MRITSRDQIASLVGLRCAPERVRDLRARIAESGLLLRGHFQLPSASHSEYFLRVRGLAGREGLIDAFAGELWTLAAAHRATAVLCPESAGFAIGEAIARLAGLELAVVKTDLRGRPSSSLRLGALEGRVDVLLVDDVSGAGSSLRRLHRAAASHGASARAALVLATAGAGPLQTMNDLEIAGTWLIEGRWPLFASADCALCKRGVPLISVAELG
ncbi:MAG TPA: phosphoribosyltransferase family protein [Kofleriaceae bacterium]|nr:phosphoribosyltransferase family protein [Kofleriaceae bacterium]